MPLIISGLQYFCSSNDWRYISEHTYVTWFQAKFGLRKVLLASCRCGLYAAGTDGELSPAGNTPHLITDMLVQFSHRCAHMQTHGGVYWNDCVTEQLRRVGWTGTLINRVNDACTDCCLGGFMICIYFTRHIFNDAFNWLDYRWITAWLENTESECLRKKSRRDLI